MTQPQREKRKHRAKVDAGGTRIVANTCQVSRQGAGVDMGWRIALALSMAIGLVIIVLSLIPGTGVPDDGWKDKVLHAIAYAMLVLPLATARPRSAPVVVVLATLMGGVIELIQPHFGRHAEWGDAVANAAGAMIGVTTGIAANRLFRRRPRGQGTAGHSGSR